MTTMECKDILLLSGISMLLKLIFEVVYKFQSTHLLMIWVIALPTESIFKTI